MRTIARRRKEFFMIPLILVAVAAFSAVSMLLWNALMPVIFQLPVINFWQALGLLVLARLFFGGFGPRRGWGGPHMHDLRRKIKKMSPEERDEFFSRLRSNREAWHREHFKDRESGNEGTKTE